MTKKNIANKKHKKVCYKNCLECNNCIPIGEGDHICDKGSVPFIVLDDYCPTEFFGACNDKNIFNAAQESTLDANEE